MANENKEIGDIAKKCKILLLDIEGTTTSISFVKDKLFPYAEENVKQFLESEWENEDVKEAVKALRKLAVEDKEKSVEGLVAIPGEDVKKEDQIEGLVNNVKWQMSSDRKVGALKQLQGLIWKQGYDKGDIKGHVYDDVCSALENWHAVDGQRIYIYSSGSVQAQKLLFGQSTAGDLLKYIDGHFDTAAGAKQESASYTFIVEKVGCKPEDVLFLTDIVKEAEAARTAGLRVALVIREGNAPLDSEATAAFAVIHSFAQLTASNKRKTDPQIEQPAKVPKTGVSNDVKTETEPIKQETPAQNTEKPEKMEVEEESKPMTEETKQEKIEEPVAVVVKEVTNSVDTETPSTIAEPAVTEVSESKVKETESSEAMETDSTENSKAVVDETSKQDEKVTTEPIITENETESIKTENKTETESNVPKENIEVKKDEENPKINETPLTIITEIEEVSDKENISEMTEIMENIEPIVEEPNETEDIEELQNVGEVLEKECDEILSKVQDVTNLDNIPLKPMLNPIVEESMETENIDSNDIVDSILETEIELEKKQNVDTKDKTEPAKETTTDVEIVKNDQVEKSVAETAEKIEKTEVKSDKTEEAEKTKEITESTEIKEDKISITETSSVSEAKVLDNKEVVENTTEQTQTESSSQAKEAVENNDENLKAATENTESTDDKPSDNSASETKEANAGTEDKAKENSTEESQVNGKTNGQTDTINQNGDAINESDLSSRLAVENGKEMNGSNGDSMDDENGQEGNKEAEVADIKVKTVTTEEPRTELIEQPTEV